MGEPGKGGTAISGSNAVSQGQQNAMHDKFSAIGLTPPLEATIYFESNAMP